MASSTGSQSQHEMTVAIHRSGETASQNIPLPYDEMDVDDEYDSSNGKANDIEQAQIEQASRSPSPEIDPESYTTWGREHFGEEWYRQRNTMLSERNIFMSPDPVYKQRQSALRMLEREVEGRTFMLPYGVDGEANPVSGSPGPDSSPSPMRLDDNDNDTPPPTPTPTTITTPSSPIPTSPLSRLEHFRKTLQWDDLEYHIELELLSEWAVDSRRTAREDAYCEARREDALEAMHDVQRAGGAYARQKRRFQERALGWTRRRVEARERDERAVLERVGQSPRKEQEREGVPSEMGAVCETSSTEGEGSDEEDYIF